MEILECLQGSDEWVKLRLGMVTASKFSDVMAKGQGKTRRTYMIKLATETMEQRQVVSYHDKNMDAGTEKEPLARAYYEEITGCLVREVGFIKRNDNVGASPDGLVGDKGMTQFKCPLGTTHARYILEDRFPSTYKYQVQGELWVAEREWNDFFCYRPENKVRPHFLKRVYRDEKCIKELAIEVEIFVSELKEMVEKFTETEF